MLKRAALVASLVALSTSAFQLSHAKGPQTGKADAGGRAIAHHAGGRVIASPSLQERAPDARLYHLGTTSREPTLGTTLNGDVFYAALGFSDIKRYEPRSSTKVMRSTDNGGTWKEASPSIAEVTHRHPVTLDPYVYVDDSEGIDRIYTIDLTVACSYLSYTDDYGQTWTTNPLACGRPVNDHQTLFGGPPVSSPTIGYPNVMYYCWNDVGSSSCSKSLDGGLTFTVTGQPAFFGHEAGYGDPDRRRFCGGLHGHGIVDDRGFVYLPRMYCDSAQLAISKDEGRSWTRVTIDEVGLDGGQDPSVAVDAKGNIYYTWLRGRLAGAEGERLPFLSISKDGGKTWTKPMMIGAPGVKEVNLATLDVGAPGKVAIAYMGSEDSPGWPFSGPYNTVTWNGYMTISANVLDDDPVFYSANINQQNDPLKRQKCGPGRCGQTVLDFIDLVIAPDGTPWAAFADACGGVCTEPDATADGEPEGLAGRLVGGPSLR